MVQTPSHIDISMAEWTFIIAFCGALFTLILSILGFSIKRLINSVDKLDTTLDGLSRELLTNYVRKEDLDEALIKLEKYFLEFASNCQVENCPYKKGK